MEAVIDMVTQESKTSAAVALAKFAWKIPGSALERLLVNSH